MSDERLMKYHALKMDDPRCIVCDCMLGLVHEPETGRPVCTDCRADKRTACLVCECMLTLPKSNNTGVACLCGKCQLEGVV